MKENYGENYFREMPANYEFETIYGKKIKMEGLIDEAVGLDDHMGPVFWLLVPSIPEQWLVWFQSKYIKQIRRTPVACHLDGLNLYKPQTVIYHPQFEIKKVRPGVMEIKIVEGSLWKNH